MRRHSLARTQVLNPTFTKIGLGGTVEIAITGAALSGVNAMAPEVKAIPVVGSLVNIGITAADLIKTFADASSCVDTGKYD
jgi:hypothetical protein